MPRKSRWTVPIPEVSLVTYMLGPPNTPVLPRANSLAYADAGLPDTHFLTWSSFRFWSQRFAAGLLAAGLQPGDRVVTFTDNDVLYPEMIKVLGVQVAPAELEAILLDRPKVLDAAVIGVKRGDDKAPRANTVPDPSTTLTDKDIMEYMDGEVSSIKKLTDGIVFTDVIPKAPLGKILRRILRERAAKESKL